MFELVIESIKRFAPFSEEQVSIFSDRLKVLKIPKEEWVIKEGQVCQHFYFVNRGSFRHYNTFEKRAGATLVIFTILLVVTMELSCLFFCSIMTRQRPKRSNRSSRSFDIVSR